jgi:hypothetical protein
MAQCGVRPRRIDFGVAPLGIISIGIVPMGVVSLGVVGVGVLNGCMALRKARELGCEGVHAPEA